MTARSGKKTTIERVAITEALLNEIKGNLFEFLVAREIARLAAMETDFLLEFGDEGAAWLSPYESYLRNHHPNMIVSLPKLASALAKNIFPRLPKNIESILVVGKRSSEAGTRSRDEADLLIRAKEGSEIPLSLKLSRAKSFVNTKSGGIKSFLTEYFPDVKNISKLQTQLSHQVDHSFGQLGEDLYSSLALDWRGSFDERWSFSKLPGELPPDLKERVGETYTELAQFLYQIFADLFENGPEILKLSLMRLLGYSRKGLVQAICFHNGEANHNYSVDSFSIEDEEDIREELSEFRLLPFKAGLSSFEFQLKSKRFQIRVKPMNVFTTASYKINCSVRHNCC